VKPVPVNTPEITGDDRRAVLECLESGWISSEGPQVQEFETLFARTCERSWGVAVSSGTGALDVAVRALRLGPGDEVLVPSMTIISCASAIVSSGATPVPVDCDETDWNAHLRHFEERWTARTRAVLLVHLYGLRGDAGATVRWARERGLRVIEDASQAQGMEHEGRRCGSFGDLSVFSLYANKVVTTGEGGMILGDAPDLGERCGRLRNLCFDERRRFWHEELGWNYRLTALQAALGTSQLRRLPELAHKKQRIGRTYEAALRDLPFVRLAPVATENGENGYWVFGLVVAEDAPFTREELSAALARDGVGTRTFFYGLHEQPALLEAGHVRPVRLPVTEALSRRGLYLPSGLGLAREDQERVIDAVRSFILQRA
jgi:perosamine synthetase